MAPSWVAPGRQVLVPEAQRAGAAALSSWLGRARPASQALPDSGPPAARRFAAPPRVLGTRPSPAPGPDASRPAKRRTSNRANRGVPGGGVTPNDGWGGSGPPVTPASGGGGGQQPGNDPPGFLRPRGGRGGTTGWGGSRPPLAPASGGGGGDGPPPPPPPPHPPPVRGPQWSRRRGRTPPTTLPPSRATPTVAPGCIQPHISGPEQPRPTAAAVPSAGSTTAPTQGHQDGGRHAARAPAPPPPPRAADGAARGASSSFDPVADAPSAPSPSQSTLPLRRQHGRASTEET